MQKRSITSLVVTLLLLHYIIIIIIISIKLLLVTLQFADLQRNFLEYTLA